MTEIGTLFRDLRKRAGLTQQALADRAGSDQSVVSRLERGEAMPSLLVLGRLMTVLSADAGECQRLFRLAAESRERAA